MSNQVSGLQALLAAQQQGNNRELTAEQRNQQTALAAKQFEAVLIRQMLKVMRESAPKGGLLGESGSGSGGDMYLQMMDEAMADQMAEGQGIGLRETLMRSMGASSEDVREASRTLSGRAISSPHATSENNASVTQMQQAVQRTASSSALDALRGGVARSTASQIQPVAGAPIAGAGGRVQSAAATMIQNGAADRWARDGALTPQDLASDLVTEAPGGRAAFNVRDANGFQGYYKCNLFAFELARRAGFQVPVVGREKGWGYPQPNRVTPDASDGRLAGGWGRVVTGEAAESLDAGARAGNRAFMLTGSGADGRHGHMGMVERIHQVDYAADGSVKRIVFDGWEGRQNGAEHLSRRVWNLQGNAGGGKNQRNGFDAIEIIELVPSAPGSRPEVPVSRHPGASARDLEENSSRYPSR